MGRWEDLTPRPNGALALWLALKRNPMYSISNKLGDPRPGI